MKRTARTVSFLLVLVLAFSVLTTGSLAANPSVTYRAHVQNVGDQAYVSDGQMSGTTGQSLRLEQLVIALKNISGGLSGEAHVQELGWTGVTSGSSIILGTAGRSLRLEAFTLRLTGQAAQLYSIQYRVHVSSIGWMGWVSDGAVAGTTGQSLAIEAVEIRLVAKGASTQTWYVKTNGGNLNVRAGASTSTAVLGKLSNGTPVNVYSVSGGWAKIQYNGSVGYVSAKYLTQTAPPVSPFQWPVANYNVSQKFNAYSQSMSDRAGRPYHSGIDLTATSDYTIRASAAGTVKYRGFTSGNGNHIILAHTISGQTVYTLYSHLANFNGCPDVGGTVSRGQAIGVMGNTGNSTNTHLHFGIFTGSFSSDPLGYTNVNNGTKMTVGGRTYYNPQTVLSLGRLP